jgi:hypothetical protein
MLDVEQATSASVAAVAQELARCDGMTLTALGLRD